MWNEDISFNDNPVHFVSFLVIQHQVILREVKWTVLNLG